MPMTSTQGEDSMKQGLNLFSAIMLIGMATPALGQNASESDQKAAHDLQSKFVAAFNRQDAAGVAALFIEDGVRVTPQGIIKGRDAIRADLEKRFKANFRDISIESQIIRVSKNGLWEAGEWSLKIGEKPARGYFALTLVREGNEFKYQSDVFNVAPAVPGEQQTTPQK